MPPDTTLAEFLTQHLLSSREKAVAVVDAGGYEGIMRIEELQAVPHEQWTTERVGEHLRTDFPIPKPDMSIRDALSLIEAADVDLTPMLDGDAFVGVVTTTDIPKLDEILDQTSAAP